MQVSEALYRYGRKLGVRVLPIYGGQPIGRQLQPSTPTAALVFCRTRDGVDTLTETLNGRGFRAQALHGGMSQEERTG